MFTTFLMLAIVGAAAGFVATRLLGLDLPILPTVVIGMLGAVVGGVILRLLLSTMALLGGFIGAVIGAVLVIVVWKAVAGRR